jgi:hypothetical protein
MAAKDSSKRYRERHPEKVKRAARESYLRQRADPIRLEERRKYHRERARKLRKTQKQQEYSKSYRAKKRAKHLYQGAKARARSKGQDFLITEAFVERLLNETKYCPMTGVDFATGLEFRQTKTHPNSPSIDKIDPNRPYSETNTRIVSWAYNWMKRELSDEEVYEFAKRIVSWREGTELLK